MRAEKRGSQDFDIIKDLTEGESKGRLPSSSHSIEPVYIRQLPKLQGQPKFSPWSSLYRNDGRNPSLHYMLRVLLEE
jgi:hypothetical protein